MSWIRIWIHLVFSTKDGFPFLNTLEQREKVLKHIKQNAESKNIGLIILAGIIIMRIALSPSEVSKVSVR